MSVCSRRSWFVVVFVTAALAVGCGDSASSGSGGPAPAAGKYVIVPATSASLSVSAQATKELSVFLYNKSSGEAVTDELLDYELASASSSYALGTKSSSTDENGHAATKFYPGGVPGEAVVRVKHPKATTLEFQITVTPEPTGGLSVMPINAGSNVVSLSDITIRMHEAEEVSCEEFQPLSEQPESMRRGFRDQPGDALVFREIAADKTVTVTARARGERGQIAAGGCTGDIDIVADQTTQKDLVLNLIPLQAEGVYEVRSYWDFSKALSQTGSVGSTVVTVLEGFQNPGDAIYDQIINLVEDMVGGLISEGIDKFLNLTGLDEQFKSLINDTIQNNEALCKVREAGRDLRQAIKRLEIDSRLVIGQLGAKYTFRGRDNWLGLQMYWRGMCDDAYEGACGEGNDDQQSETMPPCAAIELTAADNGEIASLGVISSKWDGRVASYNQLRIERHEIPLNYGRLLKYILNKVVIPELTDGKAQSLSGAFSHWIGCESLGDDITGSDDKVGALGVEVTASDISGFCESAVNTVFGLAELAIGNLEYETGIRVGGEATLVETTSDGQVDYIENGEYSGYIRVEESGGSNGAQRSNLSATWEGERISSSSTNQ